MKVQTLDTTTEKKGKARKAQRDRALQERIDIRNARLKANGLSQTFLMEKFNCSRALVCKAIAEERNSEKAINIREYIDSIQLPMAFYR